MTNTTITQASCDGADTDVPTTADVVRLAGVERRDRCFRPHFRPTTSGSSPIANEDVGRGSAPTAPVSVGVAPVRSFTSPTLADSDAASLELDLKRRA
jgi:hypothetical protein